MLTNVVDMLVERENVNPRNAVALTVTSSMDTRPAVLVPLNDMVLAPVIATILCTHSSLALPVTSALVEVNLSSRMTYSLERTDMKLLIESFTVPGPNSPSLSCTGGVRGLKMRL